MSDLTLIAGQFLRAVRGPRSQVAFSRRLGYRTNVASDWENGRRAPRSSEVFRVLERVGVDVAAGVARFHEPSAHALAAGTAAWLRALQGSTSTSALAERTGFSRHQVGRWLRGDADPRLPELLALIDALTGRMPDWIAAFVDVARVPAVAARADAQRRAGRLLFEQPWSPAILTFVATAGARGVSPGAVAAALGCPTDELGSTVDALVEAGLVRRHGDALVLVAPLTSTARGSEADRRTLRAHWTRVALARTAAPGPGDLTGFNVFAVSAADMERIRERYRSFYREIRSLVADSEPPEVAALLLVHLVDWGGSAA
ncbi:MAG: DUF4423 domain-containing protein [Alphaproteobacteria bacterium]|nr:DUF4423 domain-containing protein [Alphaproteobacteria bacterium]MCB9687259.1 DUF4423 domain-containing protein [Alphaproteobacteria bacterium]